MCVDEQMKKMCFLSLGSWGFQERTLIDFEDGEGEDYFYRVRLIVFSNYCYLHFEEGSPSLLPHTFGIHNSYPGDITCLDSISRFKHDLKTYHFSQAFNFSPQ